MRIYSWLQIGNVEPHRQAAHRFRPRLEALESRSMLATLTVTTPLDTVDPSDGLLSLREAIIDANATPKRDTIVLPAGNYTLARSGLNEDGGLAGDLDIGGKLTIKGAGAGLSIIDAASVDRVFHVLSGANVKLSGLTVTGGLDSYFDDTLQGLTKSGGGVLNEGTLTVRDCTISDNRVVQPPGEGGGAGGITNYYGALTVIHCTLSGNSGYYGGGIGNFGTLTVSESNLSGNTSAVGGAIANIDGAATISNSTLSGNTAGYGGGIWSGGWSATLTVRGCTLSGNVAELTGGGISALGGGAVTVTQSTIVGNLAAYSGGNVAAYGGGIYTYEVAVLSVKDSTITGNSANIGGGIYADATPLSLDHSNVSGNSASLGGGLYAWACDAEIDHSTLNDPDGGGIQSGASTIHLKQTQVDGVFYKDQDLF